MSRLPRIFVAAAFIGAIGTAVAAGGCSPPEEPKLSSDELLIKLRALPGVTATAMMTILPDYHYYVLQFTQLVDHDDPTSGTFQQEVSLLHIDERAPVPMVVHTSGYDDNWHDQQTELTQLLSANQVSIAHRYFGESIPANPDWTKLTIQQMAADEHVIITALKTIYGGAFLTTGGSKGGATAVFHRRFYPDDVAGTVAYVAPLSFQQDDPRYLTSLDNDGPDDHICQKALRNAAIEMLANRRAALVTQAGAQTGSIYSRVTIDEAVESAVVSLEWSFWQIVGVSGCAAIPPITASDADMFAFLDMASPVWANDDAHVVAVSPYYYQAYAQLGFPDYGADYLDPYRLYKDNDFADELLPAVEPMYDNAVAMDDIDHYVENDGNRLLFIYGQWDPWTAGKFLLGKATDSAELTAPYGTHAACIGNLDLADIEAALSMLQSWTGVAPNLERAKANAAATKRYMFRMPPAFMLALHARG